MARIPQDELERLKREVSIADLVRARGVELKRVGKDLRGRCLFHGPDETPSLFVDTERNLFICHGCSAKGSVVDLVMRLEGVTFRHAVEILRADYPGLGAGPRDRPPPKRSSTLKLPQLVEDQEASDAELRGLVADHYHQTLRSSPEALGYLAGRGLGSSEMVDHFRLGYSNRTLGYHIPHKKRKNGKAIRTRLQELGIIKDSGHELMRGSLTIPILDGQGQVVQMYGRKIRSDLRKGTPKHLYLPGPLRGVWNLEALAVSREIILCEALIDALTLWRHGLRNVTAAFGVNGFTEELLQAFKAYATERVLIAYDRDERGEAAAEALAHRLGAEGISCFRVRFPRGMDANEYALKVTPAQQSLGLVLRSAEHLSGPLRTLVAVPAPETAPPLTKPPLTKEPAPRDEQPLPSPAGAPTTPVEQALHAIASSEDNPVSEAPPAPEPAPPSAASDQTQAAPPPTTGIRRPLGERPVNQQPTTTPPSASPIPPPPAVDVPAEIRDHEVIITLGERRWRVRGLARNLSYEQLRINLLVSRGEHFHVDTLDLYSSRQRGVFLKQAAVELQVGKGILSKDLGQVLMKLEQIQEERISKALEPEDTTVKLSEQERAAALELLKDPGLLSRVSQDLETCGLVGEHTNKLVAYLATVSRKLDKPLGVMVQSSSAAGKSALMEAVLALCPAEDRVQYSAMTGQSLFYMGETDLKHKVLAIAEEEGADKASYALKQLQSEGKLSIASTGKDPRTGKLATHEYHVEGPAAILLTTTAIDLDEELLNRCVVLAVDESREQTEAIHRMQREDRTFEGLRRRLARKGLRTLHQNAQRLLRPLDVVNPYSPRLTFLSSTTRTRRDHLKYHGLIESIALLHQHQREVKSGVVEGKRVDYVEVEISDIATANHLASEVLGRTLDELPPQTRRLLFLVEQMVKAECEARKVDQKQCRFTRRQVREHTGWGNTQLKIHLHRLEEMEYLLVLGGGRGRRMLYELLYSGEGKAGERFVLGLIDVDRLRTHTHDANRSGSDRNRSGSETNRSGPEGNRSGSSRPQVGGVSGGGRGGANAEDEEDDPDSEAQRPENAYRGPLQERVVIAAASSCSGAE